LLTDPLGSLVREIASGASLGSLVEMYRYGTLVKDTGAATAPFVFVAAYECSRLAHVTRQKE